ncbi:hypothetical protein VNO77_21387 [Canavalia gladiata]|uniref:Protein kinase domain-containing protein n=1 Tax=Canavalia gladiata TaxID=3824 RepID=A0AAN9LR73_CANGL
MFLRSLGFCGYKHTSLSQRQYPTVIQELCHCHQFSLADIRKATNNFDENRVIGWGGCGKTYIGFLQHNGASDYTVAIKRLHVDGLQGSEEWKNEIVLLCQLRHPNLVSLIGFCNHKIEKILVYEYMSNRSLDKHLQPSGDMQALSWKKRLEICIGAALGLHYLHAGTKRTILHRNIQPRSILLDDAMEPKLAAFGFSLQGPHFKSKPKPMEVHRATWPWSMHGVCQGRESPHPISPVEEIIYPNIKGNTAPECWQVFIDITQRCLKYEPDEQPTMGEVEVQLEHALSLQEQADMRNTNAAYTLFSTTIIDMDWERAIQHIYLQ